MTQVAGALLLGALVLSAHLALANLLSAPGRLMNEQRGNFNGALAPVILLTGGTNLLTGGTNLLKE